MLLVLPNPPRLLTRKHSVTQPCESEWKACHLHAPSMIHGTQKQEFPLNRDGRRTGHRACREQGCAAGTDGQPTEHPTELCLLCLAWHLWKHPAGIQVQPVPQVQHHNAKRDFLQSFFPHLSVMYFKHAERLLPKPLSSPVNSFP